MLKNNILSGYGDLTGPDICIDHDLVYAFLCDIDDSLPQKLSESVNLREFEKKVFENGNVMAVMDKGKIVAASLFYCNDLDTRSAFITMFGVLEGYRKSGIGSAVISACEKFAKNAGMSFMRLVTDIENDRARAFYVKNGYSVEHIEKRVFMIKKL